MGTRALAIGLGILLTGCFAAVQRIEEAPAQPVGPPAVGPQLMLEVTNRSTDPVEVGYDFEADSSSGGGSASVSGCERLLVQFGEVGGTLRISTGGEVIDESRVQPGIPPNSYLVATIEIGADGASEITGRRIAQEVRDPAQPAIPDCG